MFFDTMDMDRKTAESGERVLANLVIFGPGRVGAALACSMQAAGHRVLAAYGRPGGASAERFEQLTGVAVKPSPITAGAPDAAGDGEVGHTDLIPTPVIDLTEAHLVLLCLPDRLLATAAQQLAQCARFTEQAIVAHTAGSADAKVLHPLARQRVRTAAMHPLQTVAAAGDAGVFRGVSFILDGEESALAEVIGWIQHIGGQPVVATGLNRARYHAAAALASNALVALAAVVAEVSTLPGGIQPYLPLMRGALRNLEQLGLPDALTGPVERGDVQTVERHLAALAELPEALAVYQALGRVTMRLAQQKGSGNTAAQTALRELFGGDLE